eukprot:5202891-Amphidinium_carterae.1
MGRVVIGLPANTTQVCAKHYNKGGRCTLHNSRSIGARNLCPSHTCLDTKMGTSGRASGPKASTVA